MSFATARKALRKAIQLAPYSLSILPWIAMFGADAANAAARFLYLYT